MAEPARNFTVAPALSGPRTMADTEATMAGLQTILQIERDSRRAKTVAALQFLIANETRRAIGARQVFVLAGAERPKVTAVSSLSSVERQSPVILWIEAETRRLLASTDGIAPIEATLAPTDGVGEVFPFRQALVMVLAHRAGHRHGAIMALRETAFTQAEAMMLQRLGETFSHALGALVGKRQGLLLGRRKPLVAVACAAGLVALGMLPVPMTALAPIEVVPRSAIVVSATLDGAIEQVAVDPNQPVKAGDVLFRYLDAQARGALDVANREVAVAEARLRQVSQLAFVDPTAKRDLAVAQTELRLKRAERDFASDQFERTVVRAGTDGIAVFADKRELLGRPVTIGQRIMEIADPDQTQFRLQVPADDALVLNSASRVRVFMDSDPLNPVQARIVRSSPMARAADGSALTFRSDAELANGGVMPLLGHRGTAQISGDTVSLAFYLLRRPLAGLRQRTGL
jgi:hypothetical protein